MHKDADPSRGLVCWLDMLNENFIYLILASISQRVVRICLTLSFLKKKCCCSDLKNRVANNIGIPQHERKEWVKHVVVCY
jgi:hypothetical protein